MSYNKTKLIETAQRYLQQGRTGQAIGEYQHILKQEPRDQVILMTVGDLLVRQGETFQALEYFDRLAQIFINDGFTTKAIAIYKKIAKLAPEETRPLERLAELYVQQGVMSEARPLYLQMAEAHLKAGRQQQGAALLRRLLEAEPDNLRVQLKMAELCVAMGEPGEAVEAYRGAAQRVLERGDHAQALKLIGRALEIDARHPATLHLKARTLLATGKRPEALALLESLPAIEEGGPEAELLIAEYISDRSFDRATALAEKIFARNAKHHRPAHVVVDALLEAGANEPALKLLGRIRAAMTESDHEGLERSLDLAAEKMPDRYEPLEWLIELMGRNNDSFRLPDILARLALVAERAGDLERARATYEQLLDRSPEDEATRRRYAQVRAKLGLEPVAEMTPFVKMTPDEAAPPAPVVPVEPPLDDETQRVVAQALTDVDLFSSYGLTQKAIELLEEVRGRAPSHAPILERLLDLNLGAGDERRTADLAAELEQLWAGRGDRAHAERFAELRRRFERAAGDPSEMAAPVLAESAASSEPPQAAAPPEFSVPLVEAEVLPAAPAHPEFDVPATPEESAAADDEGEILEEAEEKSAGPKDDDDKDVGVQEVDLSAEWAALSQHSDATTAPEPAPPAAPVSLVAAHPEPATHEEPSAAGTEFRFELETPFGTAATSDDELVSERLLSELANGFDDVAALLVGDAAPAATPAIPVAAARVAPVAVPTAPSKSPAVAPLNAPDDNADPLHQVFEEFRAELGEIDAQDEDIETHYNLGVAYREMGLLEEAISEFQKVAKVCDRDKAFRYALQCCTLLGLSFMEKGQPSIAAMWYQRALRIPDLDPETQLALRFDLGVAQDLSGDSAAALKSFAEVYATNIDYRDVAERLAALDKAR